MGMPPVTTFPTLDPFVMQYKGVQFGVGVGGVEFQEIDGLDLTQPLRSQDNNKARDHGQWIGYDFLGGRDITLKFDLQGNTDTEFYNRMQAMATATLPQLNIEAPLYFNLPGYGTLACMVRARQRSWKVDQAWTHYLAQGLQVLFHATDPRFWSQPETDEGEVEFGVMAQSVTLVGNFNCNPLIEVTTGSGAQNLSVTINGDTIGFQYAHGSSTDIFVDFNNHYAYDAMNSDAPVPVASGTWGTLVPGANTISATSLEGTDSYITGMNITWASAWIL